MLFVYLWKLHVLCSHPDANGTLDEFDVTGTGRYRMMYRRAGCTSRMCAAALASSPQTLFHSRHADD